VTDGPVRETDRGIVPQPRAVAAHVEALDMAGLAFAAKRLLGKDPAPVSGQFTMWARSGKPSLPRLTDPLWEALAPLHIGRPSSPAAALCDQVLTGMERDGTVGLRAAGDLATSGKNAFRAAPLEHADGDRRDAIRRQQALVDGVKAYWRAIAGIYTQARTSIVAGDHEGAVEVLRAGQQQLGPTVDRIAGLAREVVAAGEKADAPVRTADRVEEPSPTAEEQVALQAAAQAAAQAALADQATQQQPVADPVRTRPGMSPAGPLALSDEQAEAFARKEPIAIEEELEAERAPVEVLSTKPVRNHPFLPIVFLLIVSGVALFVLYSIINDPTNPLGG